MAYTVKAKCLQACLHMGVAYSVGDTIEVDPGTAYQLVRAGVVVPLPEKPAFVEAVKPVAPAPAPVRED